MDRKNPPRFENTLNSNEHIEDLSKPKLTQVNQKFPSSEFWNSRGNMGEKINLLIGLNLLLINLLSSLVQVLSNKDELTTNMIADLTMTQKFLSKILLQPESGLEILEKLETINTKVKSMTEELSSTSTEVSIKKPLEVVTEDIFGFFQRNAVYLDKWGIIESIDKLITSYCNLSHLGFPIYYFTACKELHRYELKQKAPVTNQYVIIQIPSFKLRNLISKLLREAPAARLLQNLRRMFPAEEDSGLTSIEQDQIQEVVEKYYKNMSEYFNKTRSLQDSLRFSSGILKNYNLGTGDLESRIPNVSYNIVKEINLELEQTPNDDLKRYILSETIILIHRLNDLILQNDRFILFLRRLK
ncbi:MAG: hypothetical protein ACFFAE_08550 [Candidatus Hodarchaeota archaeon]